MTTNLQYLLDLMFMSLLLTSSDEKAIDCGSHYTTSIGRTGLFSSPGHPNNYSSYLYCVWTISVNGKNPVIELKFRRFNLPKRINRECKDYVAIYFGLEPLPSKQIGKYCGASIPSTLVIREQSVRVEFVSNGDNITSSGFEIFFTTKVSRNSITTSQATAGIVAAIFCGIVFLGVAGMRCIMLGACQRCGRNQEQRRPTRECVGTNETLSNYVMDCPPSYRTVMEHPESFPTPNISPYPTPTASPHLSRDIAPMEEDNEEPPPPYSRIVHNTTFTPTTVPARHDDSACNVISVETHMNSNATGETRRSVDGTNDDEQRNNDNQESISDTHVEVWL